MASPSSAAWGVHGTVPARYRRHCHCAAQRWSSTVPGWHPEALGTRNIQIVPSLTKKGRPAYMVFVDAPQEAEFDDPSAACAALRNAGCPLPIAELKAAVEDRFDRDARQPKPIVLQLRPARRCISTWTRSAGLPATCLSPPCST